MIESGLCSNNNSNTGNTIGRIQQITKEVKTELFNCLDWLAASHNVTAPSTMIKVTYNKGMKDHSVTSLSGNEFETKRHTIIYKPSYSYIHNLKGGKNHRKSFDSIVFIPDHLKVANNNGINIAKEVNNAINGSHLKVNAEKKHYIINRKKSFCNLYNIMNTGNRYNNYEQLQLKQLRVTVPKVNIVECQQTSQSSISADHKEENFQNSSTHEGNRMKFLENEDCKNQNEKGKLAWSGNLKIKIKKDKIKSNISFGKEKERLKSIKNSNDATKKRSASQEVSIPAKKLKNESDISAKQVKDKLNISKVKVKEKKMVTSEKKKKILNTTLDDSCDFKDNLKKELLREDPTLPPGWKRIIKGKHVGSELKPVVCIASPEGRKFYFKARLKEYLEKNNSHLTIDNFYFGLYARNNKDREENKRVTLEGKKLKKPKKKKRSDSGDRAIGHEHESKKIRLDNSFKEAHEQFLAVNNDSSYKLKGSESSSGEKDNETGKIDNNNLLLVDPDLPPGWIRKVRVKNDSEGHNKIQVWIISPEGKKFRRKNILHKHLLKTKSSLNIDQFYFGLYPRRDEANTSPPMEGSKGFNKQSKIKNSVKKDSKNAGSKTHLKESDNSNGHSECTEGSKTSLVLTPIDGGMNIGGEEPMFTDPNLPSGWRRYIKVRSTGESAGRMEVIIVSPDGKKHRSKGNLEHYIKQKRMDLNIDDFDFSVFGKNSKRYSSAPISSTPTKQKSEGTSARKRNSLLLPSKTAYPNLNPNHSSVFEGTRTREALMINYVGAVMLNCGLRDLRSERRLRIPKEEHEKILKNYLESESAEVSSDKNEISSHWVQRLIHCRSEFGTFEADAAATVADLTKDFLLRLTQNALKVSKNENSLEYGDLAELVDRNDSLSPLKSLIPKKITFREFLKLNRPKKFTSFT